MWNQIVARAWCDEDFMKRLLSDPREVLVEHDLEAPPGVEVEVVMGTEVRIDDTDSVRRFVLPARPAHELFEELIGFGGDLTLFGRERAVEVFYGLLGGLLSGVPDE